MAKKEEGISEKAVSPKLEYFPDGGWGMKINPDDELSPEEAVDLAKAIEKNRTQPKGSSYET